MYLKFIHLIEKYFYKILILYEYNEIIITLIFNLKCLKEYS